MAQSDLAALTAALQPTEQTPEDKASAFKGKKLSALETLRAAAGAETDAAEKAMLTSLAGVQEDIQGIVDEYMAQRREMQDAFLTKLMGAYSKRRALVTGTSQGTAVPPAGSSAPAEAAGSEAGEGIRNFWLTVLENCGATRSMLEDHDKPILEHLIDVEWRVVPDGDGFELLFHFSKNPYFSNTVLSKVYPIKRMLDPFNNYDFLWRDVKGTKIEWAEGKNVTVEDAGPGAAGGDSDDEEAPVPSFFHFFNCEDVDEEELKGMSEQEKAMYEREVNQDFMLGAAFKDTVIPYAEKLYVGNLTGVDSDFEADEEDDDDWMQGMVGGEDGTMEMTPELLQALMAGGGLQGMMGGEGDDDSDEDDIKVRGNKSKGRKTRQALDEEDEDDGDDEEASAAIRAAISSALQGNPQSGPVGDSLNGQQGQDGDAPGDCKQQ